MTTNREAGASPWEANATKEAMPLPPAPDGAA